MHAKFLLTAAFAVASYASPIVEARAAAKNTYKTVLADIATIVKDTTALNTTLNGIPNGGPVGLQNSLKIIQQANQIMKDVNKSTADTKPSTPWDDDQSGQVAAAILDFEPTLFAVLDNLVVHKPAFAAALFFGTIDVSKTVEKDLTELRSDTALFAQAVISKLSDTFASIAPGVAQDIDDAFAKAQDAFKKCTGKICAPPIRK